MVVLIFGYMLYPKDAEIVTTTPLALTNRAGNTNAATNWNVNTNAAVNSNTNATTDATKDWKTYENKEFGYSIKYPKDWSIDTTRSSGTEVVFDTGIATETRYAVKAIKSTQTLDQWKNSLTFETIIKTSSTTIGGEPALKVEFSGLAGTYYGVRKGDYLYQLTDSGGYIASSGMLNTFAFTNPTADWKTYENKTWKFSFKFPKEWSIITDKLPKAFTKTPPVAPGDNLVIGTTRGEGLKPAPAVNLWVNTDGFGPFFPYKKFTITKTSDLGFKVIKEETVGAEPTGDQLYQVIVGEYDPQQNIEFLMIFNQLVAQKEGWETVVKQILSTFTFTQH